MAKIASHLLRWFLVFVAMATFIEILCSSISVSATFSPLTTDPQLTKTTVNPLPIMATNVNDSNSESRFANDVGSTIVTGCRLCSDIGTLYQAAVEQTPPTLLGSLICLSTPALLVLFLMGYWTLLHFNEISTLLMTRDAARSIIHELRR